MHCFIFSTHCGGFLTQIHLLFEVFFFVLFCFVLFCFVLFCFFFLVSFRICFTHSNPCIHIFPVWSLSSLLLNSIPRTYFLLPDDSIIYFSKGIHSGGARFFFFFFFVGASRGAKCDSEGAKIQKFAENGCPMTTIFCVTSELSLYFSFTPLVTL